MFEYLKRRRIVNAALVSHAWHPVVRDPDGPFRLYQEAGLAVRELHRAELGRLGELLRGLGVPVIAYKGLALDLLLGNTDAPSLSSDIDLLVRHKALPQAREGLVSLGYEPDLRVDSGKVRRMPARLTRMTEESLYSFGQLMPYEKVVPMPALERHGSRLRALMPHRFCFVDDRLHFKLSVDLHYTLNMLTDDVGTRVKPSEDDWWADTRTIRVGDTEVATLSDRVLTWTLLHRLYADCMLLNDPNIKALCHLKLLWRQGRLNTTHVIEDARRFPYLAPSLYYALRAAGRICAFDVPGLPDPESLRATTAPLLNLGDCLPAFLDLGVLAELGPHEGPDEQITVRVH
ncbi:MULTISPECIES: nucleotidyltransferase family protein [unclassified Streptomyces]|uniref:nucleotidyltransferase family protein n=1 Tax=Streptomyces sp. NBRC 14336 TaxID=3030992 RepID=UPI002556BCCF|nr:nucleotidyltransferase family protein [Streptomyces sp. NBRC 14336]WBO76201.1 nucleotidyltransferase family protein [Streptomyces sp. SBE_14.2]